MKVEIEFKPEDARDPRVLAVLAEHGWKQLSPVCWEVGVAFQLAAVDQSVVARQVIEPFRNLGINPRRVRTKTVPFSTRISSVARRVSRRDPDIAHELYAVVDDLDGI